eukprot:TRINITY_DN3278_c0_g1_i1.p1 TRINITY_DN3278_c0_g1~~TRINITY_DN3278_c0_g1_i1.p1  ORF type:complete len:496 (+),score=91.84 TRINITY_DN3278_c0_g1_i1:126-1613(+)
MLLRTLLAACLFLTAQGQQCQISDTQIVPAVWSSSGWNYFQVQSFLSGVNPTLADINGGSLYSSDARTLNPFFGTAGGDFGEFLIGLAVYRQLGGSAEDYAAVKSLFDGYLNTITSPQAFVFHTDDVALFFLGMQTGIANLNISNVPEESQAAILNGLMSATAQGSIFVKEALASQILFPANLTQNLIKAFFNSYWNGSSKVALHRNEFAPVDQSGGLPERALLNVQVSASASCASFSAKIPSRTSTSSPVFVNHVSATSRTKVAAYFAGVLSQQNFVVNYKNIMDLFGRPIQDAVLTKMSAGLPVWNVTFVVTDGNNTTNSTTGNQPTTNTTGTTSTTGNVTNITTSGAMTTGNITTTGNVTANNTQAATTGNITTSGSATATGTGSTDSTGAGSTAVTSTGSSDISTTTGTTPSNRGGNTYIGILVLFFILVGFLIMTYIAWRFYGRYFETHPHAGPPPKKMANKPPEERYVELEEQQPQVQLEHHEHEPEEQ